MDSAARRRDLAQRLADAGYARSPSVRAAIETVPRDVFVPAEARESAYVDAPLGIGAGQTISAPHMVAIMAEALEVNPGDRVLEIGGGSGYHAAVFAELVGPAGHVWTVERVPALAAGAEAALARAGYADRVTVVLGDGSEGYAAHAPYDRVSVAVAAPAVPTPLVDQLAAGGALVVPVGGRDQQDLLRVTKDATEAVATESLGGCLFVPLIGAHGFRDA